MPARKPSPKSKPVPKKPVKKEPPKPKPKSRKKVQYQDHKISEEYREEIVPKKVQYQDPSTLVYTVGELASIRGTAAIKELKQQWSDRLSDMRNTLEGKAALAIYKEAERKNVFPKDLLNTRDILNKLKVPKKKELRLRIVQMASALDRHGTENSMAVCGVVNEMAALVKRLKPKPIREPSRLPPKSPPASGTTQTPSKPTNIAKNDSMRFPKPPEIPAQTTNSKKSGASDLTAVSISGKRVKVFGHSMSQILYWMASEGWTKPVVVRTMKALLPKQHQPSATTIKLHFSKTPKQLPELTDSQVEHLLGVASSHAEKSGKK